MKDRAIELLRELIKCKGDIDTVQRIIEQAHEVVQAIDLFNGKSIHKLLTNNKDWSSTACGIELRHDDIDLVHNNSEGAVYKAHRNTGWYKESRGVIFVTRSRSRVKCGTCKRQAK